MSDSPITFAARTARIAPFHVMELMKQAALLEAKGRSIIHMSIGEPDFTAAPAVLAALSEAMAAGQTQYTPAIGLPSLRLAIAAHYARQFGTSVDAQRIIITAGASGALLLTMAALISSGDEILMPDPCYPCNRHFVAAFDGHARLLAVGAEDRFQLTAALVQKAWTARTRGVLVATPANPTGTSIGAAELDALVATCKARRGIAIVDEIYQGLSFDAPSRSVLQSARDDDPVIVINSFSKYFSMTGWRLGWMVVPSSMVPTFEKLAQNLFICPSALAQHAALACFEPDSLALYEARRAEFKSRRDYLVPALRQLGLSVPVTPDGAFYVYADCSAFSSDSSVFAQQVLDGAGVALVPGQDFGEAEPARWVRLSYATSQARLEQAVERLARYLPRLRAAPNADNANSANSANSA